MKEIHLTPEQLRAAQLVQLDALKEVDRVCRLHDIKYSLTAGTLLGAVRHKGYIPWDDDADIIMLRSEYEKFCNIANQIDGLDDDKFYFQDSSNTKGYRWGYGKIRRKDSLWLRKDQEYMPYGQEIFIDIFPLDALPSGKIKSNLHKFHCFLIRKMLWSEVGKHTDKNPFIRVLYSVISKIPLQFILKHYHKFAYKHNVEKNNLLRVLTFPTPPGYTYDLDREWLKSFTELEFEGHSFKVMIGYESYLLMKYGNYMKLPPEGERKKHPLSKFKLPEEEI